MKAWTSKTVAQSKVANQKTDCKCYNSEEAALHLSKSITWTYDTMPKLFDLVPSEVCATRHISKQMQSMEWCGPCCHNHKDCHKRIPTKLPQKDCHNPTIPSADTRPENIFKEVKEQFGDTGTHLYPIVCRIVIGLNNPRS